MSNLDDRQLESMARQVQDELSRREAKRTARPEWRAELDALLYRNRNNPELWANLPGIVNMGPDFYAKLCRICQRPMHFRWFICDYCGAEQNRPETIAGSVVVGEIE
jgi:hypothetical protein